MSPLHRNPATDGDDYGCDDDVNAKIAEMVETTSRMIDAGDLDEQDDIVDHVRSALQSFGRGATDTIVKENVFQALAPHIISQEIEFDEMAVYGW